MLGAGDAGRSGAGLAAGLFLELLAGVDGYLDAAVVLAAGFVGVGGDRFFLAQAAGGDAGAGDAAGDQVFRGGVGAADGEGLVVGVGADVVGVAENEDV